MKKLLRFIIFFLIGIMVLIIAFMALSPKNLNFKATETIDAPAGMVFNMVNDFHK